MLLLGKEKKTWLEILSSSDEPAWGEDAGTESGECRLAWFSDFLGVTGLLGRSSWRFVWEVHRKAGEMDRFKESEVEMIASSPGIPKCRPGDREQTER